MIVYIVEVNFIPIDKINNSFKIVKIIIKKLVILQSKLLVENIHINNKQ